VVVIDDLDILSPSRVSTASVHKGLIIEGPNNTLFNWHVFGLPLVFTNTSC